MARTGNGEWNRWSVNVVTELRRLADEVVTLRAESRALHDRVKAEVAGASAELTVLSVRIASLEARLIRQFPARAEPQ